MQTMQGRQLKMDPESGCVIVAVSELYQAEFHEGGYHHNS